MNSFLPYFPETWTITWYWWFEQSKGVLLLTPTDCSDVNDILVGGELNTYM